MKNDVLGCKARCGGKSGQGSNSKDGVNGKSAYELWIEAGNAGSFDDFLASLKGDKGDDGKSAYAIWLEQGNIGTEQDFLDSLKGQDGTGGSDLDLAAIPEKAFEEGSKILAYDASGQLYQFAQNATYEKDVSVAIQVRDNQVLDNGYNIANVEVVVSNNLRTTAENIQLTVGTAAQIQHGDTQPAPFTLDGGQSSTFYFSVWYNTSGYITATANTLGDHITSNNAATVALPFNVKRQPMSAENIYTDECQQINATYNGEPLIASSQQSSEVFNNDEYTTKYANVLLDQGESLNGKTFNLLGANSVVVLKSDNVEMRATKTSRLIRKTESGYQTSFVTYADYYQLSATEDYRFDVGTGDLTFTGDIKRAVILVRPQSENCKWQVFDVSCFTENHTINKAVQPLVQITGLPEHRVKWVGVNSTSGVDYDTLTAADAHEQDTQIKVFGGNLSDYKILGRSSGKGYWDADAQWEIIRQTNQTTKQKAVVKVYQAVPERFTITALDGYDFTSALPSVSRGGLNITAPSDNIREVEVTAEALVADSRYAQYVDIIVHDEVPD